MKIDKDWRKKIDKLGKDAYERLEMLRLGFWKPNFDKENIAEEEKKLLKLYKDRAEKDKELEEWNKELKEAKDIEEQIEKIRAARILKSKEKRFIRKQEKDRRKVASALVRTERKNIHPPFLGSGVSSGLNFENLNLSRLKKRKLPILNDLRDFAEASFVSTKFLTWLCYHKDVSETDHYHRFKIPKRNGGLREISSPKNYLRWMQNRIKRDILEKLPMNNLATAYKKGGSIINNAIPHLKKQVVVKIDLKDFFFSISFSRVRGYFHSLGYSSGMATIFALICCDCQREIIDYKGKKYYVAKSRRRLKQGALTSPILSNLIAQNMDNRISKLVKACDPEASYTRYADDIAISVNSNFSEKILGLVNKIIKEEGFYVNPHKFKVMREPQEKIITGIKCNGSTLNLPRKYIKNLRAEIYNAYKKNNVLSSSIMGKINYVGHINPEQVAKLGLK